jgi:hypothetical protein
MFKTLSVICLTSSLEYDMPAYLSPERRRSHHSTANDPANGTIHHGARMG